jgi:hypothetical protein
MARNDNPTTYAIIEVPQKVVLPADVAAQVFALLCRGEPVTYEYSTKSFRRTADEYALPTLKVFTLSQYAALALEEPAE